MSSPIHGTVTGLIIRVAPKKTQRCRSVVSFAVKPFYPSGVAGSGTVEAPAWVEFDHPVVAALPVGTYVRVSGPLSLYRFNRDGEHHCYLQIMPRCIEILDGDGSTTTSMHWIGNDFVFAVPTEPAAVPA